MSTKHKKAKKIPSGGRQTSWLFTSNTEELNQGLLRNNSSLVVRAGLVTATSGFQVGRPNHSAMFNLSFVNLFSEEVNAKYLFNERVEIVYRTPCSFQVISVTVILKKDLRFKSGCRFLPVLERQEIGDVNFRGTNE